VLAQGSTASKHCEYRNPDGTFLDFSIISKAWNKARKLGAPNYPKWQRPGLVIWHPRSTYHETEDGVNQRWGRTFSETQIDKKGRVSLCEYIEIWIPRQEDVGHDLSELYIEVLAHEYLHLIWIRRIHLEPDFKLDQANNWMDGGEAWIRKLLNQQDGPRWVH
jgi:hypothetical protein